MAPNNSTQTGEYLSRSRKNRGKLWYFCSNWTSLHPPTIYSTIHDHLGLRKIKSRYVPHEFLAKINQYMSKKLSLTKKQVLASMRYNHRCRVVVLLDIKQAIKRLLDWIWRISKSSRSIRSFRAKNHVRYIVQLSYYKGKTIYS